MSSQTGLDAFVYPKDQAESKPEEPAEPEEHEETVLDRAGEGAAYSGFSTPTTNGQRAVGSIDNECQYCGSHVTAEYVRVMGVDGTVDVCPECRSDQSTSVGGGFP